MAVDRQRRSGGGDTGTGAVAAFHMAFVLQLSHGGDYRVARQAQLRGESPAGGKAATLCQAFVEDGGAQMVIKLAVQRFGPSGIEGRQNQRQGSWAFCQSGPLYIFKLDLINNPL